MKKNITRTTNLLLTAALLCSLVGCATAKKAEPAPTPATVTAAPTEQPPTATPLPTEQPAAEAEDAPAEQAAAPETTAAAEGGENAESTKRAGTTEELDANGLRPSFKEAMDSYEAFYNEYCDFMVQYESNPTDLALLARYGVLLGRLAEMDQKFEAWEDEDLNNAELSYYLGVTTRIQQKLLATMQ